MGESEAVQNNVHHWLTNQYLNNPNNTLSLKTIGAVVYWDQGTSRLIIWHWLNQFVVHFLCSTIHQQYVLQFFACFCFFFQSNFFDEYRIEGKDETNNIYLELVPENLTRAMKSAGSAQAVKIKLTKKHTPCLTFEITLVSVSNMADKLFGKICWGFYITAAVFRWLLLTNISKMTLLGKKNGYGMKCKWRECD